MATGVSYKSPPCGRRGHSLDHSAKVRQPADSPGRTPPSVSHRDCVAPSMLSSHKPTGKHVPVPAVEEDTDPAPAPIPLLHPRSQRSPAQSQRRRRSARGYRLGVRYRSLANQGAVAHAANGSPRRSLKCNVGCCARCGIVSAALPASLFPTSARFVGQSH